MHKIQGIWLLTSWLNKNIYERFHRLLAWRSLYHMTRTKFSVVADLFFLLFVGVLCLFLVLLFSTLCPSSFASSLMGKIELVALL